MLKTCVSFVEHEPCLLYGFAFTLLSAFALLNLSCARQNTVLLKLWKLVLNLSVEQQLSRGSAVWCREEEIVKIFRPSLTFHVR